MQDRRGNFNKRPVKSATKVDSEICTTAEGIQFFIPAAPYQAPHSQHCYPSPSRRVTKLVVLSSVVKQLVDYDSTLLVDL